MRAVARGTRLECIVADRHEHDFGESAFERAAPYEQEHSSGRREVTDVVALGRRR